MNIFRGVSPDENRQRVFGGQVAGQALVAATRTVDSSRMVHSLHAYFLRPGDPTVPILYQVDRIRDGKSFTTRRVVAIQHGKVIFNLQASFHVLEPGPDYQVTMPAGMPDPDLLIRTAGEMRLSNFLLWQISYSELWVTDRFWPEFCEADLHQAIRDFSQRDRRFGGLSGTS